MTLEQQAKIDMRQYRTNKRSQHIGGGRSKQDEQNKEYRDRKKAAKNN